MSAIHHDQFPQPESNDPGSVDAGLEALWNASDEPSALDACDAFLWAMGDNHKGTYYPVVLAVLPELERILAGGKPWAQRAAIEALIDLGGTFVPEQGYETYLGGSVQGTLRGLIHSLRALIEPLARKEGPCAESAGYLLELIDDQSVGEADAKPPSDAER